MYVAGVDFGVRHDWTAAVVLGCSPDPPWRGVWMPYIAGLRKMRADTVSPGSMATMLDVVEALCIELLDHFPLSRICGDSTHDEGSCDWLGRRYGRGLVDKVNFGTKAQMALWHDTLHYIGAPEGFPWPELEPGTRTASDIAELEEQITTEQAELNGRGAYSFYHPGEHNDFLHGFNQACKAMRHVQLATAGMEVDAFHAQGTIPYRQNPHLAPDIMGVSAGLPRGVATF